MASKIKIDYVRKYWPLAKAAGLKYNLNPVAILAQRVQESGWTPSVSVIKRKNGFGLTATPHSKPTPHWKGKSTKSPANGLLFRVYDTHQDNFNDFAWIIRNKYPSAAAVSHDIEAYIKTITAGKYANKKVDDLQAYEHHVQGFAYAISNIASNLNLI